VRFRSRSWMSCSNSESPAAVGRHKHVKMHRDRQVTWCWRGSIYR
jgi:hypothetical protein